MADIVAGCSNSWVTTGSPLVTFIQLANAPKHPATRVGSKLGNSTIVTRYSVADRWSSLSKGVWRIHEMQCMSSKADCCSDPCVGAESAASSWIYTLNEWILPMAGISFV